MKILFAMAPRLVHGSRRQRVDCLVAIGAWFCMGAYLSSVFAFYADPYIAADLSGQTPALLGGLVAAIFAAMKIA